ncbi:glucosaminidase domain-containing protein [Thermogemmatispora tikiterensis]|uniref:Mannosyl-glycoprotein endo-beta-N-acetylglucosamidase-like domain-containing protein n=1 Tax=Thermogemmatispora tikiterensis TaxID=1825093 RepID=A0A328VCL1_9CHLR|nr:glucosaminidase domain-containing protein [Thermogemmatispora tikiterensis]RAQ94579.1 hypothetical protein A4R35_03470 [Thermogemmatispora tikiterensis]
MQRIGKILIVSLLLLLFCFTSFASESATLRAAPQPASPYVLAGPPSVSPALIDLVLTSYHSPAAGKGQALYDDGIEYGIDPVYALAFFFHESTFGTAGIAQTTLSLGNLRCIPDAACIDGFAAFPSWEAGFVAWYRLIRTVYIDSWGLTTVEEIIPRYAPAADHNDVTGYIRAVEAAVDTWRSEQLRLFGPVSGTTPATNASSTGQQPTPVPTPTAIGPSAGNGATAVPYPADGYALQGRPTVTVDFIASLLTQYQSPLVGDAQLIYQTGEQMGIDPVYALAFFLHDSTFGTVGLARVTHSPGLLHAPVTADCHCRSLSGYRSYQSWEDGIRDWFRYVRNYYLDQQGLGTVGQLVPAYAQSRDPLVVKTFIQMVERQVTLWRQQSEQAGQEQQAQGTSPQQ